MELYIARNGSDQWSGQLISPNAGMTDGPLATIYGAIRVLEKKLSLHWHKQYPHGLPTPKEAWETECSGAWTGTITVWIRSGRYTLDRPIELHWYHTAPITFSAYPGEQPVIDGGELIKDWQMKKVNGIDMWVTELPDVAEGKWFFRQLFVNGRRAERARLPHKKWFWVEDSLFSAGQILNSVDADKFRSAPGDLHNWQSLPDAEIVFLHYWVEQRIPVASFDLADRLVKLAEKSSRPLLQAHPAHGAGNAPYYVDNLFEGLQELGQWYLQRQTGKLYYIPLPGEQPGDTEIYAPRTTQFLRLVGDIEKHRLVQFIRFEGLTFRHASIEADAGYSGQAASNVPGAIYLEGVQYCSFKNCTIEHVGGYGIELSDGCFSIRMEGNTIRDMGAGGIKINGSNDKGPLERCTGLNRISDNHIHTGGQHFHSAVGVLLRYSYGNVIAHNHIHDLYYSGISVGWGWNYGETSIHDNRIEYNHIHNIGQGWLSDMGGIYMLSPQSGTVIRGNLIHDIKAAVYGASCIYLDDNTAHTLVENNICYNTNRDLLNVKGREHIVRNNIFAFGDQGIMRLAHGEAGLCACTFMRNVVITKGKPVFRSGYSDRLADRGFQSDLNLFWDLENGELCCEDQNDGKASDFFSFTVWQDELRQDRHSIIADPLCRDLTQFDFTLAAGSSAWEINFEPIDADLAGPRVPEVYDLRPGLTGVSPSEINKSTDHNSATNGHID